MCSKWLMMGGKNRATLLMIALLLKMQLEPLGKALLMILILLCKLVLQET